MMAHVMTTALTAAQELAQTELNALQLNVQLVNIAIQHGAIARLQMPQAQYA